MVYYSYLLSLSYLNLAWMGFINTDSLKSVSSLPMWDPMRWIRTDISSIERDSQYQTIRWLISINCWETRVWINCQNQNAIMLGMVVWSCNPNTQETEAGGCSWRWSQPGLGSQTISMPTTDKHLSRFRIVTNINDVAISMGSVKTYLQHPEFASFE